MNSFFQYFTIGSVPVSEKVIVIRCTFPTQVGQQICHIRCQKIYSAAISDRTCCLYLAKHFIIQQNPYTPCRFTKGCRGFIRYRTKCICLKQLSFSADFRHSVPSARCQRHVPCLQRIISEISNDRVEKVSDALKVGDMVDVKLLDVDFDKKRISLSMKALLNDDAE